MPHSTAFLDPEQILALEKPVPAATRRPDPASHFGERAIRLRQLAGQHVMASYLLWMAELVDAQQRVLTQLRTGPCAPGLPVVAPGADGDVPAGTHTTTETADAIGLARARLSGLLVDGEWIAVLHALIDQLQPAAAGEAAPIVAGVLQRLRCAPKPWLQQQAQRRLALAADGVDVAVPELDAACAPFIAAALQVQAVHRLSGWSPARGAAPTWPRVGNGLLCPCCASGPTASVVQLGGAEAGSRYLHCSLCQTQWHLVRVRCALCGGTEGIRYQGLQRRDPDVGEADAADAAGANDAAGAADPPLDRAAPQLESCDVCRRYLKIVDRSSNAQAEPVADDLASLALDLLASQGSWRRGGINLLWLPGPDQAGGEVH